LSLEADPVCQGIALFGKKPGRSWVDIRLIGRAAEKAALFHCESSIAGV